VLDGLFFPVYIFKKRWTMKPCGRLKGIRNAYVLVEREKIKVMGKRKRKGKWEWFLKEEMSLEEFIHLWGLSFSPCLFSKEGRELKRKILRFKRRAEDT